MDLSKQYSTCGVNGFAEAITEMGFDLLAQDGVDFGLRIINTINDENDKRTGHPFQFFFYIFRKYHAKN